MIKVVTLTTASQTSTVRR